MYFEKIALYVLGLMMKKIMILFFTICFFGVYAAPVGNPLNPEIIEEGFFITPASWMNFRLGYEGNFVSDARMDKKTSSSKIDNFKNDSNSASFTLNLQNRTDLFAVLGASRIRSDWRFDNAGVMSRIELETNYRLYGAAGGKAILFQWGSTVLSVGGRYSFTEPSITFITRDGALQDKGFSRVKYHDWQVDLGTAHKIDIFAPYLGVKYLNSKAKIKNVPIAIDTDGQNQIKMKKRDHFGVYVGCSLSNGKYFMMSVEARFIDEEGISVTGDIKF